MQFTSCSTERAERLKNADNDSMNELEENDVRRQLEGRLDADVGAAANGPHLFDDVHQQNGDKDHAQGHHRRVTTAVADALQQG